MISVVGFQGFSSAYIHNSRLLPLLPLAIILNIQTTIYTSCLIPKFYDNCNLTCPSVRPVGQHGYTGHFLRLAG